MNSSLKEFGKTATGLSKNPLGIIALFIVLVYGFASLVVGFNSSFETIEKLPLIWFLVIFPVFVLVVFGWLVSQHHEKLYAPSDYKEEKNFVATHNPSLQKLEYAKPNPVSSAMISSGSKSKSLDQSSEEGRENHRNAIYARNKGYFLTHVIEPSEKENQAYDIFIYLVRHKSKDYSNVKSTEFFFGSYWGNKIYEGSKVEENLIGLKTSAYGEFLCTCRVVFSDDEEVILERYIDFEMAKLLN